jgi:hypothetical protein
MAKKAGDVDQPGSAEEKAEADQAASLQQHEGDAQDEEVRAEAAQRLHVEVSQQHHQEQQPGKRRKGELATRPAQEDAEPDAQEASHEQEVGEEADVLDGGRYRADEEQLGEEQGAARQNQPGSGIAQAGHRRERQQRSPGGGHPDPPVTGRHRCGTGRMVQPAGSAFSALVAD